VFYFDVSGGVFGFGSGRPLTRADPRRVTPPPATDNRATLLEASCGRSSSLCLALVPLETGHPQYAMPNDVTKPK